jgi:type IX secretion system PorP/SprF family membrane protein
MRLNISIFAVIIFALSACRLGAQDIHLSQYHFDRLQINPALTGMFSGDRQVALLHKQQYFSVPVDYLTFSGSYDQKFLKTPDQKGFFSAGALFNYDRSGDSRLSLATLSLNGSYTRALAKGVFAGIGAYLGGGQRSFSPEDLYWDNQWTGSVFDPNLPSGEQFDRTNFFFLDLGAGANLRLQGQDRTKLDLGVGAFHLNEPNYAFYETSDARLPIRMSIHALGILKLGGFLDLYANGLYQTQGPYNEALAGGGVILHLSNRKAREIELHLGAAARFEDAIIPMVALGYDGWKGGFAYDINTSAFDAATDGYGGPEFFLTYTFKKLWPFPQTKVCSIF